MVDSCVSVGVGVDVASFASRIVSSCLPRGLSELNSIDGGCVSPDLTLTYHLIDWSRLYPEKPLPLLYHLVPFGS